MTTNQLIEKLQAEVAKHPKAGEKEILITRDNGKRTVCRHEIMSWGWRCRCLGGRTVPDAGRITIGIDFDGKKC